MDETSALTRRILEDFGTLAVVGLSADPTKAAHSVPAAMQAYGWRVLPVNPHADRLLGEPVVRRLADITEPVDVVNVFRPAAEAADIARQAVAIGAKALGCSCASSPPRRDASPPKVACSTSRTAASRSNAPGTRFVARHDGRVSAPDEERPDRGTADAAPDWNDRRTAFGGQADAYARGRPSYPLEALRWALPTDAHRVLDLAAGTGRLTTGLLDLGLDVVAVEPLPDMRAHVHAAAAAIEGTAEHIPADDASFDAVTVGQAFHWFDVAAATAEIRRVLRPGGRLVLVWNMLDDSHPWVDALAEVLNAEDRVSHLADDQPPPYDGVAGMSTPIRRMFRHVETYDVDRLLAFVHSRSQTILLPDEERRALLDAVRALAPEGEFPLPLVCETWRGERVS